MFYIELFGKNLSKNFKQKLRHQVAEAVEAEAIRMEAEAIQK